jgi:hypothetical protein
MSKTTTSIFAEKIQYLKTGLENAASNFPLFLKKDIILQIVT